MKRLSKYLERLIPAHKTLDDIINVEKVMSGEALLTKEQAGKLAELSPYIDADLIVQLNRDDNAAWKSKKPRKSGDATTTSKSPMAGAVVPSRPAARF